MMDNSTNECDWTGECLFFERLAMGNSSSVLNHGEIALRFDENRQARFSKACRTDFASCTRVGSVDESPLNARIASKIIAPCSTYSMKLLEWIFNSFSVAVFLNWLISRMNELDQFPFPFCVKCDFLFDHFFLKLAKKNIHYREINWV